MIEFHRICKILLDKIGRKRRICTLLSGNSSVGRAQPCQGWGREFESRFPLQVSNPASRRGVFTIRHLACMPAAAGCRREPGNALGGFFTQIWLSGRVVMQRPAKPCTSVRFRAQPPYSVPNSSRPGGEIGRRNGLKIRRPLRPCRFESGPGHQRFKEVSESVSDCRQQTGEQACDRSW